MASHQCIWSWYECRVPQCLYITDNSNCFRFHKDSHQHVNPSVCQKCDFRTLNPSVLQMHYVLEHDEKFEKKCDNCSFASSRVEKFERHRLSHERKFSCNVCNSKVDTIDELESHRAELYRRKKYSVSKGECLIFDKVVYKYLHTSQPPQCQICEEKFKSPVEFRHHSVICR